MIRKSRMILVMCLTLALGVAGIAWGAAVDQESTITANLSKTKLPKKKFANTRMFVRVETHNPDPTTKPSAPTEEVYIDFDDDIRVAFGGVPECLQPLEGTTTDQAKGLCPTSTMGGGAAAVFLPNGQKVSDLTVTAFHGNGNQILLHSYSATLGSGNTQVVKGNVINSPLGGDFGKRLSVPDVPDVASDTGALVDFSTTLRRRGVIKARCHDGNKRINWRSEWHYDGAGADDDVDVETTKQRCRIA